jgi:hypothetical protein
MGALPAPLTPPTPPAPPAPPEPPAPSAPPVIVRKCNHCGKEFPTKWKLRKPVFCSAECSEAGRKIARLGKEKPVTLARISSRSDMPHQIIQEGDVW